MKIQKSIFIGGFLSIIFIVFLNGIIQLGILSGLGINILGYRFSTWGFSPFFEFNNGMSNSLKTFIIVIPLMLNLLFIEIPFLLLKRISAGLYRNTVIIFLLLLTGNLLVVVFYEMIELIINPVTSSRWENLLKIWNFVGNQKYVFVAFIILALFTYLQLVQKRTMKFFNINKFHKQ